MAIFEDVTLGWKGEEFTVKATEMMRLIAKVESEINLQELTQGQPPMSKLAFGYAAALSYAGAKVTAEEIYASMFDPTGNQAEAVMSAVSGLLALMMPPSTYAPATTKKKPASKAKAKQKAK